MSQDRRLIDVAPMLGLSLAIAVVLAVAGVLLGFTHAMSDDHCRAVFVEERGVIGAVYYRYLVWMGRWFSIGLQCAFSGAFDLVRWYAPSLLAIWLASLFSLRFLLGSLPSLGGPRLAWSLAVVLFVVHWAGQPAPGQTVYWLAGAIEDSLSVSAIVALTAVLLRLPAAPTPGRALTVAGLAVAALGVAGFHELFACVLCGVMVFGTGIALWMRDGRWKAWAVVSVAALVGLGIVLAAPGNEVRPQHFPAGQNLQTAFIAAARMWLRALETWVADPKLLAATALLVCTPALRALRPDWARGDWARILRIALPLATVCLLTGAFLAGGWALGRGLPQRALNGLYMVFLLGWFSSVFVWSRSERSPGETPGLLLARGASALLLALFLLISPNLEKAVRDLVKGKAAAFDREWKARYAEAERVGEGGRVVAHRILPWPESYHDQDIVADPADWKNTCLADFLGVASVTAVDPEAPGSGASR